MRAKRGTITITITIEQRDGRLTLVEEVAIRPPRGVALRLGDRGAFGQSASTSRSSQTVNALLRV
jgi:hypothetical protein